MFNNDEVINYKSMAAVGSDMTAGGVAAVEGVNAVSGQTAFDGEPDLRRLLHVQMKLADQYRHQVSIL
jgi:hypothetical protein